MHFYKMQGTGNDYVYIDLFSQTVDDPQKLAVQMAKPHFGVGADGLVLIGPSDKADFSMRIFNADGSESEMCGNATRCVGLYVYESGRTDKEVITLETRAGIRTLYLTVQSGRVLCVRVDMGTPMLGAMHIPTTLAQGDTQVIGVPVQAGGRTFAVTCVNVGNPHAVVFLDEGEDVEGFNLAYYGPLLEQHEAFPQRTNVEFANVLSPECIRMRVWERGSGETQACGTGACATLVAAVICNRSARKAQVILRGGTLDIEWEKTGTLWKSGPAQMVFEGDWLL